MHSVFEGIDIKELFEPVYYTADESTKRLRDLQCVPAIESVELNPEHPLLQRWSYNHLHFRIKDISKQTYFADDKKFELVTEPNDVSFIKMLLVLSDLCSCDDTIVVYLKTQRYLNFEYRQISYTVNGKLKRHIFNLKNIVGDPINKYPHSRQYQSFREAITEDIYNLKLELFKNEPVLCPISGITLNMNNCHMDHCGLRFAQLVHQFLDIEKLTIDKINCNGYVIGDAQLRDKWIQFHRANAKLRLLSAEENIRQECKRKGCASPVVFKKCKSK